MKKLMFLLIAFLITPFICNAQIKGIDKYTTVTGQSEFAKVLTNEVWFFVKLTDKPASYVMFFDNTPVGLKHAVEETIKLCKANSKDFNNPDIDNSMLPSYAETIFDYGSVHTGLSIGSAEIRKVWDIPGWRIGLTMDDKTYMLMAVPIQK
jgi:hypothetical protein